MDETIERDNPQHQFSLRSYLDMARSLELNGAAYYVDQTLHLGGMVPLATPAYIRLDLGLTWRPFKSLEVAFWGQMSSNSHFGDGRGACP